MNSVIINKTYRELAFCEKEILRYAGCRKADTEVQKLLQICMDEVRDKLSYRVCYRVLPVTIGDGMCDFGFFRTSSQKLALNLSGCSQVVLFAATVGVGVDRLIAKYGRISPAKALLFQAIGAAQIEMLCDIFCQDMEIELCKALHPRFSPGYGDLSLESQKDIFSLLDCEKRIGLTLNESLLMSPSKSVTAFAGISNGKEAKIQSKCAACDKKDCAFRRGVL